MYVLIDTFNDREISKHRTIAAAVDAKDKHLSAVRRANGENSYLTYSIRHADGRALDDAEDDMREDAEIALASRR